MGTRAAKAPDSAAAPLARERIRAWRGPGAGALLCLTLAL
jgi:hypothetical protein